MGTTTNPVYRNAAWGRARRLVLARDGGRCQIQGDGCTGDASHVDHVVPLSEGGEPYDPANLRAACRTCNLKLNRARQTELAAIGRAALQGRPLPAAPPAPAPGRARGPARSMFVPPACSLGCEAHTRWVAGDWQDTAPCGSRFCDRLGPARLPWPDGCGPYGDPDAFVAAA